MKREEELRRKKRQSSKHKGLALQEIGKKEKHKR
jgi:hypothetical protein